MSAIRELQEKIHALKIVLQKNDANESGEKDDDHEDDANECEEKDDDHEDDDDGEDDGGDGDAADDDADKDDDDDHDDGYDNNEDVDNDVVCILEACELVEEHQELEADFEKVVDLLSACWNDRENDLLNEDSTVRLLEWMIKYGKMTGTEHEKKASVLNDFFALVGGVRLTYLIYQEVKAAIQEEVVTETALREKNDDDQTTKRARSILRTLRSIWVYGTDLSGSFAQALATTGYLAEVVKEVEIMYEGPGMDGKRCKCLNVSATLLHNFARHVDSEDTFDDLDSDINAVGICTNIFSTTDRPDLRLKALLTLSYIIDEDSEEQMSLLKADHEVDFLLQSVRDAFTSKTHRDQFGFRLDELLSGLRNLAENDDSSRCLLKKGVLKELAPILKDGNDAEKEQVCDILYVLALTDGNMDEIHKNKDILGLLKKLAEHDDDSVKDSAQEALFVMTRSAEENTEDTEDKEAATPKQDTPEGHVMLSYSWGNKEKVLWIRDKLKERNYRVWIDVDDLKGHLKEAMADAVENAWVVLVCFSKSYAESKNCKKECDYADELKKRIIPLKMEDFKPRGWLGISIAGNKYLDFSGNSDNNKVFDELIKELENKGKK